MKTLSLIKHHHLFLPIFILCFSIIAKANDSTHLAIARSFIKAIADNKLDDNTILQKYLCTTNEADTTDRAEQRKLLIGFIKRLRRQLSHSSWTIKPYLKLPLKDQTLLIGDMEKPHIYTLLFDSKELPPWFIWVKDNKILSFLTMDKGGTRVFLEIRI